MTGERAPIPISSSLVTRHNAALVIALFDGPPPAGAPALIVECSEVTALALVANITAALMAGSADDSGTSG